MLLWWGAPGLWLSLIVIIGRNFPSQDYIVIKRVFNLDLLRLEGAWIVVRTEMGLTIFIVPRKFFPLVLNWHYIIDFATCKHR